MYNSEENTVLRDARKVFKTWDWATKQGNAVVYMRLREKISESSLESHYDPEDWTRFTPEVVSYLDHAAKVFRKFVAVYGN